MENYKAAAEIIKNADILLVAAGAGMSVDSGLPDYRSTSGLWNKFPLYKRLRKDYAAMATPRGFEEDLEFTWGFFAYSLNLYRSTTPHAGYDILKKICGRYPQSYFVITTNVDGHFLKAGFPAEKLHECHGTIHKLQCIHACDRKVWSADNLTIQVDEETMRVSSPVPHCPMCGAVARPNIFMFGDHENSYVWEEAQPAADRFSAWFEENKNKKLVVLEIGSGTGAPGLRAHCEEFCSQSTDSTLIRINLDDPETPRGNDIAIKAKALDALSEIWGYLTSDEQQVS